MIATNDLIEYLCDGLKPVSRFRLIRQVLLGVGAGAILSTAIMLALWGLRPDFAPASETISFWTKFAFTLALSACGLTAAVKLGRPDGQAHAPAALAALAVLVLGGLAIVQLATTPDAVHPRLIMGASSLTCPWLIVGLSVPILAGGLAAVRELAPTRLRLCGAATGLAAGGTAAFIYAFSCGETGMAFVFLWYGLGIAAVISMGVALGPRVLRW